MNALLSVFAGAAAISLFAFDKYGHSHKPIAALLAWLYFIGFTTLAIVALLGPTDLIKWLLLAIVALNALSLWCQKGNVTQLFKQPSRLPNWRKRKRGLKGDAHARPWF